MGLRVVLLSAWALLTTLGFVSLAYWHEKDAKNTKIIFEHEIRSISPIQNTYTLTKKLESLERLRIAKCLRLNRSDIPESFLYESINHDCASKYSFQIAASTGVFWIISFTPSTLSFNGVYYIFMAALSVMLLVMGAWTLSLKNKTDEVRFRERVILYSRIGHDSEAPLKVLSNMLKGNEIAQSEISRIRNIVNISGLAEPRPKPFCLLRLLSNAIASKSLEGQMQNIAFTNKGDFFPCNLSETEITRHFSNLINNAVEATPAGSPPPSVLVTKQGQVAQVKIQNFGVPIPKSTLKRLGKTIYSSKPDGQGIGLYSAMRYFESTRGAIKIRSGGQGTEVLIDIPLCATTPAKRILHIDDDKYLASVWAKESSPLGVEYHHFINYAKFLDAGLRPSPHDMVVVDQYLSNSTLGIPLAEEIIKAGWQSVWIASDDLQLSIPIGSDVKGILDKCFPQIFFRLTSD